jgi:hypothetical protein
MLAMLLAGCLDVEHHYSLNPDGSGKVTVDARITDWTIDASDKDVQKKLQETVKGYLDSSRGVEAWTNVTYALEGDKVHFTGTAYFPDVTNLESNPLGLEHLTFDRQPNGDRVFGIKLDTKSKFDMTSSSTESEGGDGVVSNAPLTDEQIQQQIDSMKSVFSMMRSMMGMMLDNYRIRTSVRVPGTTKEMSGFVTARSSDPTFTFEGKRMLSMLDSLIADSVTLRRMVTQKDSSEAGDRLKQIAFPNGEPRIVFAGGGSPLFDYRSEVAAAQADYANLLRQLSTPPKTKVKGKGKIKKK